MPETTPYYQPSFPSHYFERHPLTPAYALELMCAFKAWRAAQDANPLPFPERLAASAPVLAELRTAMGYTAEDTQNNFWSGDVCDYLGRYAIELCIQRHLESQP